MANISQNNDINNGTGNTLSVFRNCISGALPPAQAEQTLSRAIQRSELILSAAPEAISRDFRRKLAAYESLPPYKTKWIADDHLVHKLSVSFPEFKIECGTAFNGIGHAFARESRALDQRLIYEKYINYSDNVSLQRAPSGMPYDVMVKDVGGNIQSHLMSDRHGVHCCNPVLNFQDVSRKTERDMYMQSNSARLVLTKPKEFEYLKKVFDSDQLARCSLQAQNCNVRAPFVTFAHSTYDMTLSDIVHILDRAECQVAYAWFIYDPIVHVMDSGVIPNMECSFRKFSVQGVRYIEFNFTNDVQLCYVHKFDSYIALVSATRLLSRNRTFCYNVDLMRFTNSTMYVRITRSQASMNPAQLLIRNIPFTDSDKYIVVHTWQFSTINDVDCVNNVKPIRIVAPKRLVSLLSDYCLSLAPSQFLVAKLLSVASAINRREVISGQTLGVDHPLDSDDLVDLVYSIYFKFYIKFFEANKLLQTLVSEEGDIRKWNENGIFTKILKILSGSCNKCASHSDSTAHPLGDSLRVAFDQLSCDVSSKHSSRGLGWFCRLLKTFCMVARPHPVIIHKGHYVLTIQQELPCFYAAIPECERSFVIIPDSYDVFTSCEQAEQLIRTKFPEIAVSHGCKPCDVIDACQCSTTARLSAVVVPGDGNCFYHSLIKSLNITGSVDEIKQRLLLSKFMRCFTLLTQGDTRERLRVLTTVDESHWANENIIHLASMEYDVAICLHTIHGCRVFNPVCNPTVHISYRDHHYEPLIPQEQPPDNVCRFPMVAGEIVDDTVDTVEPLTTNEVFESVLPRNYPDGNVRVSASVESLCYHELCFTGNFGYSSNYGVALADVLCSDDRAPLSAPSRHITVLDIDSTNKSSVEFFSDTLLADLTALSKTGYCSSVYHGYDVRPLRRTGRVRECATLTSFGHEFDLVCLNPAVYFDQIHRIDNAVFDDNLYKMLPYVRNLRVDGIFVMAFPLNPSQYVQRVLSALCGCFKISTTCRSQKVPPHFPWVFFVGQHFMPVVFHEVLGLTLDSVSKIRVTVKNTVELLKEEFIPEYKEAILNISDRESARYKKIPVTRIGLTPQRFEKLQASIPQRIKAISGGFIPTIVTPTVSYVFPEPKNPPRFDVSFVTTYCPELLCDIDINTCFTTVVNLYIHNYVRSVCEEIFKTFDTALGATVSFEEARRIYNLLHNVVDSQHREFYLKFFATLCGCLRLRDDSIIPLKLTRKHLHSGYDVTCDMFLQDRFCTSVFMKSLLAHESVVYSSPPLMSVTRDIVDTCLKKHKLEFADDDDNVETKILAEDAVSGGDAIDAMMNFDGRVNTSHLYPICGDTDYPKVIVDEFISTCKTTYNDVLAECNRAKSKIQTRLFDGMIDRACLGFDERVYCKNGAMIMGTHVMLNSYRYVATWDDDKPLTIMRRYDNITADHKHVFAFKPLKIFTEYDFYILFEDVHVLVTSKIGLVQAAAGCGKTTRIMTLASNMQSSEYLILTSTNEGCEDVRARLSTKVSDPNSVNNVCTIDSYLMHNRQKSDVVLIDEALMQHPGKILLVAHYSKAKSILLFGDALQIPYINRLPNFITKYSEASRVFPVIDTLQTSWRVPKDVAMVLDPLYRAYHGAIGLTSGMESNSHTTLPSMSIVEITSSRDVPSHSNVKYLCFTQSEKKDLAAVNILASTVHEYQGKESDIIYLVRLSRNDSDAIYKEQAHAVTAITRHKMKLVYYSASRAIDAVRSFINSARNHTTSDVIAGGALLPIDVLGYRNQGSDFVAGNKTYDSVSAAHGANNGDTFLVRLNSTPTVVHKGKKFCGPLESCMNYVSKSKQKYAVLVSDDEKHVNKYVRYLSKKYDDVRLVINFPYVSVAVNEVDFRSCVSSVRDPLPITLPGYEDVIYSYPKVEINFSNHAQTIQQFINQVLPGTSFVNTSGDYFMFHHNDYSFAAGDLRYDAVAAPFRHANYDNVRPLLSTSCYHSQISTPRHVVNAISKRNCNVPNIQSIIDVNKEVNNMIDRLFDLIPSVYTEKLTFGPEDMQKWLRTQPDRVASMLGADFALDTTPLDHYKFALKPSPKPDLTVDALCAYPQPQTIIYSEKFVNIFFCTLWGIVRDRIIAALPDHIVFYTQVTEPQFANHLNKVLSPRDASAYRVIEFDMKKYDKSQGEVILEFECALLSRFGVDTIFIDLWRNSHAHAFVRDPVSQLSFETVFQRKSGDASTFLGNTLALLVMVLDVVPIDNIVFGAFAGDDSLLFVDLDPSVLRIDKFMYKYNLEVKMFEYEYHYFCSKFVIDVDNMWHVVPDPLKRAVKLGRFDLRNMEHVEDYRKSFKDNVVEYSDYSVASVLSKAVSERYNTSYDSSIAILTLGDVARKGEFNKLYYSLPGDRICVDPTRPVLEL